MHALSSFIAVVVVQAIRLDLQHADQVVPAARRRSPRYFAANVQTISVSTASRNFIGVENEANIMLCTSPQRMEM
jgi:hypothetical protein